jgi:cell division transport system ATP-binding protein
MFNAEPVVSLQNAFIYQNDRIVLNDVNFTINKGEFVFLIGRTGSGKSSLLKTLYADLWLQQGTAKVAGYQIEKMKLSDDLFTS